MLFPQSNALRQQIDLSGFWEFRDDPDGHNWSSGLEQSRPIAVPSSWNEQFNELLDYLGDCWYQTRFALPWGWDQDKQVRLRFGSVNYLAEVWLNGVRLGDHEGGNLPFEFDVTDAVQPDDNLLVVRVNGTLAPSHVPPGNVPQTRLDSFMGGDFPSANFDFFPYGGIHRPVILYATAKTALTDLTVVTTLEGETGQVHVALVGGGDQVHVTLRGFGAEVTADAALVGGKAEVNLSVPGARLWSPDAPNLYDLTVDTVAGGLVVDRYTLAVGIRTIAVEGDQLLLNGKPIFLRGFGRHEDFPAVGRGYLASVVVKDYELMKWIGANSYRTSHYPYSEQMMDMADRLGILVIDETPAVGLFFDPADLARRQEVWKQEIRELIDRDKNHPSVFIWSLANEPHNQRPESLDSFKDAFALARSLDSSRLVTFVSASRTDDPVYDLCDVCCVNRYDGWYVNSGQLEVGFAQLAAGLDDLHARYHRPVILTEFGADAIPGLHADPPEMFSEEYQAAMVMGFIDVVERRPFMVGAHVWNLCDFKTGQSVRRINALNHKGVFTRDRRPKLVAHKLREHWVGK